MGLQLSRATWRSAVLPIKQTSCTTVKMTLQQAYRESAKRHHPDKGGSAQAFARVQAAFEVLCDPRKRAVYDEWARELQFRYVPGVTTKVCCMTSYSCTMDCLERCDA